MGIPDSPPGFPTNLFSAVIDVTVELMGQRPELAPQYSAAGFEALWRVFSNQ